MLRLAPSCQVQLPHARERQQERSPPLAWTQKPGATSSFRPERTGPASRGRSASTRIQGKPLREGAGGSPRRVSSDVRPRHPAAPTLSSPIDPAKSLFSLFSRLEVVALAAASFCAFLTASLPAWVSPFFHKPWSYDMATPHCAIAQDASCLEISLKASRACSY